MTYHHLHRPSKGEGEAQHAPEESTAKKRTVRNQAALQQAARHSTAERRAAKEHASNDTMPDNKGVGWRKKIQSRPKESQPLKAGAEEGIAADDATDRRRHHGWRKTIQGSRPATPVGPPATPSVEDADEARGERPESATPRRNSKPKLTRYTSLFSTFKETPKGPDFAEPWNDLEPDPEPYVDPDLAIQAVRSHMISYSMRPIPVEHNNGLFRVFEAYHKLKAKHEHLLAAFESTDQELEDARSRWGKEERRYAEEIRRLELLIAQGATGIAGVLCARQGSVVDRKRMHRKTISSDRSTTWNGFLTQDQVDNEIRIRSQKVLLHRPTSPSGKMVALSRQFTGKVDVDLCVGTPPSKDRTLARKVQSELNLAKLSSMDTTPSVTDSSLTSGFSGGLGDPLPDEVSASSPAMAEMTVECDAFVALRELGALVARRRGLNTESFVDGLMKLLSMAEIYVNTESDGQEHLYQCLAHEAPSVQDSCIDEVTPKRTLRRFQSQPQLASDQKRRRHFSFEPGEDHLQALKEELTPVEGDQRSGSSASVRNALQNFDADPSPGDLTSPYQSLSPNTPSSKIPSPVAPFGSLRRESSVSSLQSTLTSSKDRRHNSQSSIRTAFRENQGGGLRPCSSSRSSSFNNLRGTELSPSPKNGPDRVGLRNSIASLSAARAADQPNRVAKSGGSSPARSSTNCPMIGSFAHSAHGVGQLNSENHSPNRRDGAASR